MRIPILFISELMKDPANRLEVPTKIQYTDRMENKKYLIVDKETGRTSRLDNQEFNNAIEGLDAVSDHFNSWVCESYIIIELPAWGSKQKQP